VTDSIVPKPKRPQDFDTDRDAAISVARAVRTGRDAIRIAEMETGGLGRPFRVSPSPAHSPDAAFACGAGGFW
jgi:hypothetical protein